MTPVAVIAASANPDAAAYLTPAWLAKDYGIATKLGL